MSRILQILAPSMEKKDIAPAGHVGPDYYTEGEAVGRIFSQIADDLSRNIAPTHVVPRDMLEAASVVLDVLESDDDPEWRSRVLANVFREFAHRLKRAP